MIKSYTVRQGTKARLVNTSDNSESPFDVRRDMVFGPKDTIFTPESTYDLTGVPSREYGFVAGDSLQRSKYVLVVNVENVEFEEEDK